MKHALNSLLNYTWPKHAGGVTWNQHTIAGAEPYKELSDKLSIEELLTDLFDTLNFSQFSILYNWANECSLEIDWNKLCQHYNLRWSEILKETIQAYLETPIEFQNWCFNKKLSARDLAPLLILENKGNTVLKLFSTLTPSKSEGTQLLDLICDLVSMGVKNLFPETEDTKKWFKKLYKLRHPQSTATDSQFSDKITAWPWPKDFNTDWKRTGDKSFIDISFKVENQNDFDKKLSQLNYVKDWANTNSPTWDQPKDNQ